MKKALLLLPVLLLLLALGWIKVFGAMKAEEDAPPPPEASEYLAIADSQMALGAYGAAIDYYSRVLELEDTQEVRFLLSEAYEASGQDRQGEKLLEQTLELWPDSAEAYERLGSFRARHYDYAGCVETCIAAYGAGCFTQTVEELYFENAFRIKIASSAFDAAGPFYNHRAYVLQGDAGYYVTSDLDVVLGPYAGGDAFLSDVLAANTGEGWEFLTRTGMSHMRSETEYQQLWSLSEGRALAQRGGSYYYVDDACREVLGPYQDGSSFYNGVAAVKQDGAWQLIDLNGNVLLGGLTDVIINEARLCSNKGVIFASAGQGYDMYAANGQLIRSCGFEDAQTFFAGTLAAVKQGGKWGFVNTVGEMVLEAAYEDARSFGHGLAAVKTGDAWGFILPSGREVIPARFQDAGAFSDDGIAPVMQDGKWYYIQLLYGPSGEIG